MAMGSSAPKDNLKTSVAPPLFERFLRWCCRHEFSWPHTGAHGQDYQTCLICGAIYEFDTVTMTRTGRQLTPPAP